MGPPWFLLLVIPIVGGTICPDGTTCGEKTCAVSSKGIRGSCGSAEGLLHPLPMVLSKTSCFGSIGCPDEYSCVNTPQGGKACCPFPGYDCTGTSCQDGHHCCPSGFHCPQMDSPCIPVCCNDNMHFCPHNTVCDLQQGRCVSDVGHLPWSSKLPASVKCPDRPSCPDGATCCKQRDSSYGCCPMLTAVCCSDHYHCCPSGTICDLAHKKCVSPSGEGPLLDKIPAVQEGNFVSSDVQCDDLSSCPDKQTCCRLASGEWGCCPIEQAVCCDDHVHCCPTGYSCSEGQCQKKEHSIPWLSKTPSLKQQGNYQTFV
ncbi:hypothetical protein GDO86_014411 [Hymenochirus boettgeri]|uniref:Granulins domain-containing protein n=1 Tax=Hymenochirus boettgeri TaxID=247094 RepID=A0A8T2JP25_9PIPI|nr:hypothetical protein GDO86_014411 [Hymenochirus boettgeri]